VASSGHAPVIRVLLVDDQPLVRAGLARILGPEGDMEIVAECADGAEVEAAVAAAKPDIVVMDVRMKNVDGTEATRRVRLKADAPPVLTLTTFDDDEVVAASLAAGASGFILKDARGEDLIAAVRAIASGGAWLDPAIAGKVIEAYRSTGIPRAQQQARLAELTEREIDVLRLIGRGSSNTEIGEQLFISEGTVKSHIGHIFTKLDLRDRAAAIVFAFDHALVEPGG
jgi:DNA-binding NarL/FixJ family response regulator